MLKNCNYKIHVEVNIYQKDIQNCNTGISKILLASQESSDQFHESTKLPLVFLWWLLIRFLHSGICSDGSMNLFVHRFNAIRLYPLLDILTKV